MSVTGEAQRCLINNILMHDENYIIKYIIVIVTVYQIFFYEISLLVF